MSFRARLFAAFLAAVLVPIGVLAWGVRDALGDRVAAEHGGTVESVMAVMRGDLGAERAAIRSRISAIAEELAADSRFRLATSVEPDVDRRWLLDYGTPAMRRGGLALLQVQDAGGKILTSGHFRNEYDRTAPELPQLFARAGAGAAIVRARTPGGIFLALASIDSFAVEDRRFYVVGGVALDSAFVARLARDPAFEVSLDLTGSRGGSRVGEIAIPLAPAEGGVPDTARFVVTERANTLAGLERSINQWLLSTLALTLGLGVLVAGWLASRVSRPLRDLAEKTAAIDLDRLEGDFDTDRRDEIGSLSRLLGDMTRRLRAGTAQLREAERRAAVGEVARQVNHDIKNGLAPIRHVLRHLTQVAAEEPASLPAIFSERRETLESSVGYLETLARNYARLSPEPAHSPSDANAVVREVLRGVAGGAADVRAELHEPPPIVRGDALMLRRILQNLVGNAVESLDGRPGTVTVRTDADGERARITVADTGRGMSREQLDRAFDDFYTTKEGGTGLGLSVVRRLVADLEGTLRVETEPGIGTRFVVDLPAGAKGTRG